MCASSARTNHLSSLTVKIQIHIAIASVFLVHYILCTNQPICIGYFCINALLIDSKMYLLVFTLREGQSTIIDIEIGSSKQIDATTFSKVT